MGVNTNCTLAWLLPSDFWSGQTIKKLARNIQHMDTMLTTHSWTFPFVWAHTEPSGVPHWPHCLELENALSSYDSFQKKMTVLVLIINHEKRITLRQNASKISDIQFRKILNEEKKWSKFLAIEALCWQNMIQAPFSLNGTIFLSTETQVRQNNEHIQCKMGVRIPLESSYKQDNDLKCLG